MFVSWYHLKDDIVRYVVGDALSSVHAPAEVKVQRHDPFCLLALQYFVTLSIWLFNVRAAYITSESSTFAETSAGTPKKNSGRL
jgi:hypothetical protein